MDNPYKKLTKAQALDKILALEMDINQKDERIRKLRAALERCIDECQHGTMGQIVQVAMRALMEV